MKDPSKSKMRPPQMGEAHDTDMCHYKGAQRDMPRAIIEAKAPDQWNSQGCCSAPAFFAYSVLKDDTAARHCVVMSKVPGFDVGRTDMAQETILKIRSAFKIAVQDVHMAHAGNYETTDGMRDVHSCGVDIGSHHARNLVCDVHNDKCYIVDDERVHFAWIGELL
ncbi:hypothetical protein DOTSEDRAFT_24153 [Dothistroma septosporum NZE10]|uniref:Uncharacterized protein n=1 Tax=Dothistroma septosporum (strain NZE10 / CBS 128990) TaxID=675120 RepID=N1PL38_DOTSN|nr:hypothetical protein DOTSEDRAFT_24153 [Dothistroma septosporum NZE10]